MKRKFAKILESKSYGQLLIIKSALIKSKDELLTVNVSFIESDEFITIKINPTQNSIKDLDEIFNTIDLKEAERYIEESNHTKSKYPIQKNIHYIKKTC
jgi:hypothetical protein